MNISDIEKELNYKFNDISYLEHALVHKSASGTQSLNSNERMEFLGDAVLQLAISTYLYNTYPKMPEGKMAKLRASLVCQTTLANFAHDIDLGKYIKLGKGELLSEGMQKPSILSDAFEAILGAIYVDGSYDEVEKVILNMFAPIVELHIGGTLDGDYKTKLQEILQKHGNVQIKYTVVEQSGLPHDMNFVVNVTCNDVVIGNGSGKSKKNAEQAAAKQAIERIESR